LLDTGDALIGGGTLGDRTQGAAIVAGMNFMGYDAMALGPKELSLGVDLLKQRMDEAEFPVLSANAVLTSSGELVAEPYTIIEVDGHRVGVIGLTHPLTMPYNGFDVLPPQQAIEHYVPEVAWQVDTVIVLTNLEYQAALALAGAVPGIDLVVAALPDQSGPRLEGALGTGTLVAVADQALPKHSGRRVGVLTATIQADGSLTSQSWQSLWMDKGIADSPEMDTLLSKFW